MKPVAFYYSALISVLREFVHRALRSRIGTAIFRTCVYVLAIVFTAGFLSAASVDHTQRRLEDLELYHRI